MWAEELFLFSEHPRWVSQASQQALSAAIRDDDAQMRFRQWLWTLHPHVSVASPSAPQLMNVAVKNWLNPLC